MARQFFKSGDRILLRVKEGRKERTLEGVFQAMQTKSRVIVWVDDPRKLDDDGMRLVDIRSVKPFYNHPTDQQRRAVSAVRRYKIGVRIFRLDKPDGKVFCLETLDAEQGIAVGRVAKRKTVLVVKLHQLFPNLQ